MHNPSGPPTHESAAATFESWRIHWDREGFGYWTVLENGPVPVVLGFGGIMRKNVGPRFGLNLYFRLAPSAWGKGVASAIAREALLHAFLERSEPEVLALVRPGNLASRRTLERAHLKPIDITDDVPGQEPSLIYRIGREEFRRASEA